MAKVDTSLVAHLPLFGGVKPEDLEEILREARSARYRKNSAIFEQGADAQSFFLLLHGHVRAARPRRPASRSWCDMSRRAKRSAWRWRSALRAIRPRRSRSTT